jgi:AraC-like DNA-binding protein
MQKRSFPKEIRYDEAALDPALPIRGGEPFSQRDRPIRFLHFHQCLELGYCYSGRGIFMVGEKILPFQAGDVSFINHTEVHLARSAPGTASEWTWIYLDPVRLVGPLGSGLKTLDPAHLAGPSFGNILSARRHPRINRIVTDMVDELRGGRKGRADALRALAWQLMVEAQRLLPSRASGPSSRIPEYDRMVPALQHLSRTYAEPVRIAGLARRCGMSEPHFRRIFLRAVGQGPRSYWHGLRLHMAASLLSGTSRSVLEISQEVGFETLSSFNRLFLKTFGVPPRVWRSRHARLDASE